MIKTKLNANSRFSEAPPGYSLTGGKGQWAWERPPEYATAPEAVDAIIDNLEKPEIQAEQVKLLAAGVSIEEIVNTTVKLGFMEGKFSVDVAEVIKAPLAYYYMGLATEAGIDANVFSTKNGLPRTNYGMDDSQILGIMKDRNPDFHKFITQGQFDRAAQLEQQQMELQQNSFLGTQEMPEDEAPEMEEAPAMEGELMPREEQEQ